MTQFFLTYHKSFRPPPGICTAGPGVQSELVLLTALGKLPEKYDLQVSTERDQHKKYAKFNGTL